MSWIWWTIKHRWPQRKNCRPIQLDHRRLKEAFAPGAADGELFINWLPAHSHLRYKCVGVIVSPILKTRSNIYLQRMEARNTHLRPKNWNPCFTKERHLFAAGVHRVDPADAKFLWMDEVALVIRIDGIRIPAKSGAQGKANRTTWQIKQVSGVNVQVQRR